MRENTLTGALRGAVSTLLASEAVPASGLMLLNDVPNCDGPSINRRCATGYIRSYIKDEIGFNHIPINQSSQKFVSRRHVQRVREGEGREGEGRGGKGRGGKGREGKGSQERGREGRGERVRRVRARGSGINPCTHTHRLVSW